MGLLPIFIQAFLVGLSGAVAPGPLLTYNIQLTYKKGFWIGPKLIVGHAILEGLLILGVIFGLGSFIQLPVTKITLWLVGGMLLAWMGYELIWKETKRSINTTLEVSAAGEVSTASKTTNMNPVLAGIIISLSNPYWALWWAMIGLGLITQALTFGWVGVTVFFIGHILSDFAWYSFISAAVAKGRHYMSEVAYHWLLRVCGIFLLIIAAGFILDALKALGIIEWIFNQSIDLFKYFRNIV